MKKYHIFVYNSLSNRIEREAFITANNDISEYIGYFNECCNENEKWIYKEVNDKNAINEYETFDMIIRSNDELN